MPLLTPQYDFHRIEEIPDDFFLQHGIRALLLDVEEAMEAMGEVTGATVREDITARIFERFCVGK